MEQFQLVRLLALIVVVSCLEEKMLKKIWVFIKSPGLMAVITLAAFGFGIYGTLFYERKPGLTLSVLADSTVFDVHTNISKLDVLYAGEDLRKSNETLRLITLRILNSGKTDIVKRDYDETDLLGFTILNGKILELSKVAGSNDYLQKHLHLSLIPKNQVFIAPVILEAAEFIDIQALVLTQVNAPVRVLPLGKLAGIRKIEVVELSQGAEATPMWDRLTNADVFWIQFIRGPVYFGVFLLEIIFATLIIVAVTSPIQSLLNLNRKRNRQEKLSEFLEGRELSLAEKVGVDYYLKCGVGGLVHLNMLLGRIKSRGEMIEKFKDRFDEAQIKKFLMRMLPVSGAEIAHLEKAGVLVEEGVKILVRPELSKALLEISSALDTELLDKDISLAKSPYAHVSLAGFGAMDAPWDADDDVIPSHVPKAAAG